MATNTYSLNPSTPKVSTDFDLNFNPSFSTDLLNGEYVVIELPTWENGFTGRTTLTCKIRELLVENTFTIVVYSDIDWILVYINKNILASSTPLIKLSQLNWPRTSYQLAEGIKVRRIRTGIKKLKSS